MPTDTALQTHIRWIILRDLPEVLSIEAASFTLPWEEQDIRHALRQRNCIGMVAELKAAGTPVVGYMIYELHRRSIHLSNLAVHPGYRRRGIGAQMLAKLRTKLDPDGRNRLTADVSEATLGTHLFLRACGLTAVGVERCAVESVYRFCLRV